MRPTHPVAIWAALGADLALAAGCASQPEKAAGQKTADEYVWYTPTGSNIPIRVRKSDLAANSEDEEATQDALRTVQDRGRVEHRKEN